MSIVRFRITPTPSNTATNTPTITPSTTSCFIPCFSGDGTNTNGTVDTILQDVSNPDKMLIVGRFTNYNGVSRNGLVRSFVDGEVDTTFNPGTGTVVSSQSPLEVAQQSDGKYIIVGTFQSYNGTSRNRIARINNDGALDTTFNPGTGYSRTTRFVLIEPSGKYLIGSNGTQTYSGSSVGLLTRLNTDASLDNTFNNNTLTGTASNFVSTIHRNSDGTLYVAGLFSISGRTNIVKLNADGSYASTDPFNTSGVGADSTVQDFKVQDDGKIIIVGDFPTYNGTPVGRIVRINPDGTRDTSFAVGAGYSNNVFEIELQDSKYITVGFYSSFSGISVNNIIRLNNDGSYDNTWNSGNFTSITSEDTIQHLRILTGNTISNGFIFCGGFFNSYDGVLASNIVKMNRNGNIADCDPIVVSPTPTRTPTRTPSLTATITTTITNSATITSTPTRTPTLTPTSTIGITPTNTNTPTITPTITQTSTPTGTIVVSPTMTSTPTITPTITNTPSSTSLGCQQIFLYPNNINACDHSGGLTQYDTDNSLTPTRFWVLGECGITPVSGGNLWFSQGPSATSYQVDNGGFVINTFSCP